MNKTLVRILSGFMPNKEMRKNFRSKYEKKVVEKIIEYVEIPHTITSDEVFGFVKSNICNSDYFEFYQKLYHLLFGLKSGSMHKFIVDKISKENAENTINELKQQYPDKEILFLTDTNYTIENARNISIDEIKDYSNQNNCLFVVGYNKDYIGLKAVNEISKYNFKYYPVTQANLSSRYFHTDKYAYETLIDEWNSPYRKIHFCPIDFENIFQALNITRHLEGDFVEIGTFQGASAHAALNYMQKAGINRKSYFFDTYEGFNYAEAQNSQDALWNGTHTETSYDMVKEYLSKFNNYEVVKSNICSDELPTEIEKIAVANIDVDMYDAIKSALYKVKDKIVQHGIIIVEDFGHTPCLVGAQKAYYEFMEEFGNDFIPIYGSGSQMLLIKK